MHEVELIAFQEDGERRRMFRWAFTGQAAALAIVVLSTTIGALAKSAGFVRYELRCPCGMSWGCRDARELLPLGLMHLISPALPSG
jgi:hypothetical protein